MGENDQIRWAIEELKRNPMSRDNPGLLSPKGRVMEREIDELTLRAVLAEEALREANERIARVEAHAVSVRQELLAVSTALAGYARGGDAPGEVAVRVVEALRAAEQRRYEAMATVLQEAAREVDKEIAEVKRQGYQTAENFLGYAKKHILEAGRPALAHAIVDRVKVELGAESTEEQRAAARRAAKARRAR